jgi:hypothetical protein
MGMPAGQPRVVCFRIVFNQHAGDADRRATLTTLVTSSCKRLGRNGGKIAFLIELEQACARLVVRRRLCWWILSALALFLASSRAEAACVDLAVSAHATVSITRNFDEEERRVEPNLLGIRGTGWFISARSLVTVAHVAEAMHLSADSWTDIEIRDGENKRSTPVRLLRVLGARSEKIAVLDLKIPFSGARILPIRTEPLVTNEHVVSVAYPDDRLRVVDGRFVKYGADDKFAGTALLELYDGDDRLVLDHGASGAPVLDCEGRVAAVVSNLMTQTMQFMSHVVRISTAWNTPNVVSVPIQVLKDFTPAD